MGFASASFLMHAAAAPTRQIGRVGGGASLAAIPAAGLFAQRALHAPVVVIASEVLGTTVDVAVSQFAADRRLDLAAKSAAT